MRKFFIAISVIGIMLASCTSQKKLTYLRNIDAAAADSINQKYIGYKEPVIKAGDQLLIFVSAINPEAASPYNLPTISYMNAGSNQVSSTNSIQTYQVDEHGKIYFPVIGELSVAGMTKEQVRLMLVDKISESIKDPIVSVKFIGFQVSVTGEVAKPGKYSMPYERVNIFEALAAAGDMTPYGKRNTVLVTREQNGKLEFARLNLNSPEIFSSPYFFLQQNDIVYVEPNNVRAISSQNISLYLSMITSLASMATVIVSVISISN